MASRLEDEFVLVLEAVRCKKCESEPIAVSLDVAPLILCQHPSRQDIVKRLFNRFRRAALAVDQDLVAERLLAVGHQTIGIDNLEFYGMCTPLFRVGHKRFPGFAAVLWRSPLTNSKHPCPRP